MWYNRCSEKIILFLGQREHSVRMTQLCSTVILIVRHALGLYPFPYTTNLQRMSWQTARQNMDNYFICKILLFEQVENRLWQMEKLFNMSHLFCCHNFILKSSAAVTSKYVCMWERVFVPAKCLLSV